MHEYLFIYRYMHVLPYLYIFIIVKMVNSKIMVKMKNHIANLSLRNKLRSRGNGLSEAHHRKHTKIADRKLLCNTN